MRRLAFALLASTVLVGAASAADLSSRRAASPAMTAPVSYGVNWTGVYLGAHAGYGWGTNDWRDAVGPVGNDSDGFLGGGQIGLNYQFDNIVLGIQGDFSGTTFEGSSVSGASTFKNESSWLASVTGRVGFTFDRALFYVKGGGAWTDLDSTINGVSKDQTRSGWTVGGGLEYAVAPNWSTFIEYDYYDFGDKNTVFTPTYAAKINSDVSVVKLGVNYRFGGSDPVVRKY